MKSQKSTDIDLLNEKILKLEQENKVLRDALDASAEGVWDWYILEDKAFYNDKYFEILGYKPEEFQGRTDVLQTLLHPDDKDLTNERIKYHLTKKEPYDLKFRLRAADGKHQWIRSRGKIVEYNENGEPSRAIGTHTIITNEVNTENKLLDNDKFLNTILSNFPGTIWQTDTELRLLKHSIGNNPNYSFGLDKFIGQKLFDIPGFPKQILQHHKKALEGFEVNYTVPVQNFTFKAVITPVFEGEKVVSLIGLSFDITQLLNTQNALLESEKKFRMLFENAPDPILLADYHTGNISDVNKAAIDLFGYSKEEFKKLHQSDLHPKENESLAKKSFENAQTVPLNLDSGFEFPIKKANGETSIVEIKATEIELNKQQYKLGFFRNISKKFEYQTKLEESEKALKQAIQSKDTLYSIVTHDLRSPLSGFLTLTKMLTESFDDLSLNELFDVSLSMMFSAESLYVLLENLLNWIKMQRDLMKPEPQIIDLSLPVENNLKLFKHYLDYKKIEVNSNLLSGIEAYADPDMIETVFRNILSNCVKFSKDGTKIEIKHKYESDMIMITFSDEAGGMTKEQIDDIIEFENFSTENTEKSHTGIGLHICKELIKANSGKFDIQRNDNPGSDFIIKLPVAAN